jgi:methionine biosynthesis protein MetW
LAALKPRLPCGRLLTVRVGLSLVAPAPARRHMAGYSHLMDTATATPVRYVAKNMRLDLRLIAEMIPERARVLDIGCGDGTLMAHLAAEKGVDARGIEIDMKEATEAVSHGLAVIHGDADHDLAFYPDAAFDFVVLSRTLQAVEKPREVLRQMLRIGRHAIVSFPNFGHWEVRWKLLVNGRMPDTETWNRPWYETPNIHPCTISDFFALAEAEGYVIERWLAVDERGLKAPWRRSVRLANIFGQQALFQLRRR